MKHIGTTAALAVALFSVAMSGCVHHVDDGREDNAALFLADGDVAGHLSADDEDGWLRTPAIAVNDTASRIGVRFDASGPFAVEARVSFDGGATFGAWKKTTTTFAEEIAHNAFADIDDHDGRSPTHVELRFLAPVEAGLTFVAVDAFVPAGEHASSSSSSQALAADGIATTRDQWGARASNGCSTAQTPKKITIHHTESPNNDTLSMPARMRQLQNYAMDVRGFCDIGFHFLVGQDGVVYQGRNETLVGAHAAGANQDNVGIALIGTFSSHTPSDAMLAATAKIMSAVSSSYGMTLSSSTVKAHRDINGTDCPGDSLYAKMSSLITAAKSTGTTTTPPTNPPTNPPPSSGVYAGLTQGSAVIPHQGVSNPTLANALGMSTEPYGTVVTAVNGQQFVQGKVSWFGGPNDTGVTSSETGSVAGDRLRGLNSPTNASASTIASRPQDFYFLAMRWDYAPGRTFWKNARILLVNPDNGKAVVVRPEDWGPNTSTGRIVDISPQAMKDLGTDTDHKLLVAFAQPNSALGVVDLSAQPPPSTTNPPPSNPPPAPANLVIPAGASWQWQLTGTIDTTVDASVYDIDLFDAPTSTIASLKSQGRRVICYFSAGTYEPWRPDASQIPSSARGNSLDAPFDNEKWLDTRSSGVRSVMKSRLDLAVQKGCDGVEPDNVDGYQNSPGFSLTASTQLDFNRFLATEAHARNLSVGLKNDTDQLADLVGSFDWALNEECYDYNECDGYASTFIAAGKAVLNAEYDSVSQLSAICAVTQPLGLSTIVKNQDLDAPRTPCP